MDLQSKKINRLNPSAFSELGLKERVDLQEWIDQDPSVLGEDLLIIQKEFTGFETRERPDLLGLDKRGNLVVIENKLDDSGKDVVWQALKYASYCSNMTTEEIHDIYQQYLDQKNSDGAPESRLSAKDKISEFFDGNSVDDSEAVCEKGILNSRGTQRIILVAANFRPEVTSTVLWLQNYGLQIKCIKVNAFVLADNDQKILLKADQIIPIQEAEEFMIGMAKKAVEEKIATDASKQLDSTRFAFWKKLLEQLNSQSTLYKNISPSNNHWLSAGSGVAGIIYNFNILKDLCRVALYINDNKEGFDELFKLKDKIEAKFGDTLEWQPLEGKKACRIKFEFPGGILNEEGWDDMAKKMAEKMIKLEQAMKEPLEDVKWFIKNSQ